MSRDAIRYLGSFVQYCSVLFCLLRSKKVKSAKMALFTFFVNSTVGQNYIARNLESIAAASALLAVWLTSSTPSTKSAIRPTRLAQ